MLTTTLNRIRNHNPCQDGWAKLLKHLGKTQADDEPLPYSVIVESNGIEYALWCCRAEPKYDKQWRTFSLWCARQVQHLMKDERSIKCLDTVQDFIDGKASEKELDDARAASWAASLSAWAASWADWDAYWAASSAAWGASSAAWGASSAASRADWDASSTASLAVWNASIAVSWAASRAAWAASWAAWDASSAAWDDSSAASRAAQTKKFLEIVRQKEECGEC